MAKTKKDKESIIDILASKKSSFDIQHLEIAQSDQSLKAPMLFAHSEALYKGENFIIKTGITPQSDNNVADYFVEFSTRIGKLPNNALGLSIVNKLNQFFSLKFVLFVSTKGEDEEWGDLVALSSQPSIWIKVGRRLDEELRTHVETFVITKNISKYASEYSITHQTSLKEIDDFARLVISRCLSEYRIEAPKLESGKQEAEVERQNG